LVKDERGDLLADPHRILNRWKNYFCQLLNAHGAGGVRQTEMHTAEPSVAEPSASVVEVAVGKLKSYKSSAVYQIPAELIQAGWGTLSSETQTLKLSGAKANCLITGTSQFWYLLKKRAIKLNVVIIEAYHCCQLHTKFSNILLARLTPCACEVIGDHHCGLRRNRSKTGYSFYIREIPEKKWEYNGTVH
jgi:hypothetical protein